VEEEEFMQEGREVFEDLRRYAHPLIVFYPRLQQPWFPLWMRYVRARERVYDWMNRYLAVRRARGTASMDVLEMLMNARDENGDPVGDEHIRYELNAILTAGHETTGVALGWALYELGRHPEAAAKLRSELRSAGSDPDPGLLLTLPYLDAVCKETIRLHPILAECARVPMKPLEILGRTIPAGQALVISIVGIHHDPSVYPEPDRFLPERFLDRTYNLFEFMPFGGGHRRCLGAGLAEYTMRIALAETVMIWDFEPAGRDRDARLNVAMGPKRGIPLRIKGRVSQET
jgi:cytochrome P450